MHLEAQPYRALRRSAARLLILSVTLATAGCVRHAAKQATEGALSAVEEKVAEGRKARGAGQKPGGRLGRRGGEGERIGEPLAGGIVSGSLEELNRNLVPLREVTREAAAAAASGALQGADGQRAAIARMVADATGAAGQAFARAMAEEMRAQIERGLGGGAQLPDVAGVESAASQIARRAAAAAVGGATDQLATELTTPCAPDDPACLPLGLQRASRAIVMGMAEGVQRKIRPWHVVVAFLIGVALTAGVAAIVAAVAWRRRERAAPPPAPAPPPHAPIRQVRHAPPRLRPHAPGATP